MYNHSYPSHFDYDTQPWSVNEQYDDSGRFLRQPQYTYEPNHHSYHQEWRNNYNFSYGNESYCWDQPSYDYGYQWGYDDFDQNTFEPSWPTYPLPSQPQDPSSDMHVEDMVKALATSMLQFQQETLQFQQETRANILNLTHQLEDIVTSLYVMEDTTPSELPLHVDNSDEHFNALGEPHNDPIHNHEDELREEEVAIIVPLQQPTRPLMVISQLVNSDLETNPILFPPSIEFQELKQEEQDKDTWTFHEVDMIHLRKKDEIELFTSDSIVKDYMETEEFKELDYNRGSNKACKGFLMNGGHKPLIIDPGGGRMNDV